MFFILSKALLFLLSPFTWMVIAVVGSFLWKKEKGRKRFKWAALILFLVFTNTIIFSEFCRLWEVPGKKITEVENFEVGIVLTGMAEYNTDLNIISIRRGGDRIWQALTLYHAGKIKKIFITGDSGYISNRGLHEAKQMKEVLIGWGIPEIDILTEEKSRNTYENAVETKKILSRSYPHFTKFILITSGSHMKRAKGCFDKVGLKCETYSTDLYTGPSRNYFWDQYFIPSVSNFDSWNHLIKEFVGYQTYDMIGYI